MPLNNYELFSICGQLEYLCAEKHYKAQQYNTRCNHVSSESFQKQIFITVSHTYWNIKHSNGLMASNILAINQKMTMKEFHQVAKMYIDLDLSSACVFSSHCSEMVSSSCSLAIARSMAGSEVSPTARSISCLMVSRERPRALLPNSSAWCTAANQRAISSLSLSWGTSGRYTSNSEPSSSRVWISGTESELTVSERTFSLWAWKSSIRFSSSWKTKRF